MARAGCAAGRDAAMVERRVAASFLATEQNFRRIMCWKGLWQLETILRRAQVRLALACGKIRNEADRTAIRAHFEAQGWDLWDEPWLREHLQRMADQGYENQVSAVVAKLLLRGKVE